MPGWKILWVLQFMGKFTSAFKKTFVDSFQCSTSALESYLYLIYWLIEFNVNLSGVIYVMFWPFDPAKNAIQGYAPEGSDTF